MTETSIRRVEGLEMKQAFYDVSIYAFAATPPLPDKEKWFEGLTERPGGRCWAVFEDGRAAVVLGYSAMQQNVRGKLLSMGGVWGVASAPESRRKGYVRQGMAAAFANMREDGMAVSGLYPFRESFYERLGYVTYTFPHTAKFLTAALAPLLKKEWGGSVERIAAADGEDVYRRYLEAMRARVHGMAFADDELAEKVKDSNNWMLVVKEEGIVTGIMVYLIAEEAQYQKVFKARRFYYSTPLARMRMLEWIARHIDQTEKVEIHLAPFEHPETWMADLMLKLDTDGRAPMGRVIDVSGLSGISAGVGCFSACIIDPACPWNEGAWRFESVDGILRVECATSADNTLSIHGLSAWVFGSIDPVDFALRSWGELSDETVAGMHAMLPLHPAYMHEFY